MCIRDSSLSFFINYSFLFLKISNRFNFYVFSFLIADRCNARAFIVLGAVEMIIHDDDDDAYDDQKNTVYTSMNNCRYTKIAIRSKQPNGHTVRQAAGRKSATCKMRGSTSRARWWRSSATGATDGSEGTCCGWCCGSFRLISAPPSSS